jgi:cation/acetate symporter
MIASDAGRTLSVVVFFALVAASLAITFAASRRARGASGFFVAGRRISARQNALAIVGDLFSAAAFLGISGMVALKGFDGVMYSIGFLVALITVLLVVAEPLRNLGRYTLTDVMAYRLDRPRVRAVAAVASVVIILFYLLAQMVGVGVITSLLLGIDQSLAIALVGVLMMIYVTFGGMVATTYVQLFKAVLLIGATVVLTLLLLGKFGFNYSNLLDRAAARSGEGGAFLLPGLKFTNHVDLLSLGLGLVLGTAGLPHIMMRFYTVPDAQTARRSAVWVMGIHGSCLFLMTLLGFGAAALVGPHAIAASNEAGNSAAPLLAQVLGGGGATLGGQVLFALVSAVAFATILAVVAGLAIGASANISHDLYTHVLRRGEVNEQREVRVARVASLAVGLIAVVLALAAKSLNVAFLVGLAFAMAASANLPVLIYSLHWRRFNTAGAVGAVVVGLSTAVGLAVVGPSVIGPDGIMLHGVQPLTTLSNPGIVSVPAGFLAGWLATILTARERRSEDRFDQLRLRALTGHGAERAVEVTP